MIIRLTIGFSNVYTHRIIGLISTRRPTLVNDEKKTEISIHVIHNFTAVTVSVYEIRHRP